MSPSDPAIPAKHFKLKSKLPDLNPTSLSNLNGIYGFIAPGFPGPNALSYDCKIDASTLSVGLHTFTVEVEAPLDILRVFASPPQEFTVTDEEEEEEEDEEEEENDDDD